MADTYTSSNRIRLQTEGGNTDDWGELNNINFELLDAALDGILKFTLSGTKILTSNNGSSDEARSRVLWITSGTGGTVQLPAGVTKLYHVINDTSGDVAVRLPTGTIATVAAKDRAMVFCDGADCFAFAPRRDPVLVQDTGALSSGTQIDFLSFDGNRSGQYFIEFKGLSHSSGSPQNLRISASTGTASVWQTIGSFAAPVGIYGALTLTMPRNGAGRGGVIQGAVFDGSSFTTQIGASAPVAFPLRAATTALHIDFGGSATFDAGSVRLWEL